MPTRRVDYYIFTLLHYIFGYLELQENKLFQLHLLEILQNTNL